MVQIYVNIIKLLDSYVNFFVPMFASFQCSEYDAIFYGIIIIINI